MVPSSLDIWLKKFLREPMALGDTPPFPELAAHGERIKDLLQRGECAILRSHTSAYQAGNSIVISSPQIDLAHILKPTEGKKVALNLVRIAGPANEEPHFHHSHVLAITLMGKGKLLYRPTKESMDRILVAKTGDVVVIPRGALHVFTCEPGGELLYAAMEMAGQDIDYQKHFHAEG